jgi:tetratricopeptide (TPR) repeat protein
MEPVMLTAPVVASRVAGRPRTCRGWLASVALLALASSGASQAMPHIPDRDDEVLASLPRGVAYSSAAIRQQAGARLDVALPLAQFYLSQARVSGDLRFLGYAEGLLAPWRERTPPPAPVLVMHATLLQSRHAFAAALSELDEALALEPEDAQAWLTRAAVLRVLGRYGEADESCEHLVAADAALAELCRESLRGLEGELRSAYAAILALPQQSLANSARAWRCSELGEMAVRMADGATAAHWFAQALELEPDDVYTRAAYADLLLGERRAAESLALLQGYASMEPMLLRIALAQQLLGDPRALSSRALLASAFSVEEQRGDAVHRREQARFLLDLAHEPAAALAAAQENWRVQREPADLLILLRAAQAARRPAAGAPAREFVAEHAIEDARLAPYLKSGP